MKTFLAAVTSVALVVTPMAASAQSYGHGRYGEGWSGRGSQQRDYVGGGAYRGYSRGERGGYSHYDHRGDHRTDIAGAAIIAGVAGLLLGSALSSQQSSGYSQPYAQPYAQPYQSYGYSPSYSYQSGW